MNRKNMPLILMLVAGAVTCIITFIRDFPLFDRMLAMFIVLLVFYFLGSVLKWTLDYFDKQNEPPEEEEEEVIEQDADGVTENTEDEKENPAS